MTPGKKPFAALMLVIWAAIVVIAVTLSFVTAETDISPQYDRMTAAAETAKTAMDAVRKYRIAHGMEIYGHDKLGTGMIGSGDYTAITTTDGILEAKRTACDPNWAAVIVSMFIRAGLKEGDEVGMVFSGSFPSLNICALAAAQEYGVKVCAMSSVGASFYGANDPGFTFFDMQKYLCDEGILKHRLDLVSLGGENDTGESFPDPSAGDAIMKRVRASGTEFIYEEDFEKNIAARVKILKKNVPHMGFLLNVGGSSAGVGTGADAYIKTGYRKPDRISKREMRQNTPEDGLLQVAFASGIPVASMLNIRGLAKDYGIPYDSDVPPVTGAGSGCVAYYDTRYDVIVPSIALCISACLLVFYYFYAVRGSAQRRPDERNHILHRG